MRQSKSENRRQAWLERKRKRARAETEHAQRIERECLERERAAEVEARRETMQQDFLLAMQRREQIERVHEAPAASMPPQRRRLGHGPGRLSALASLALLAFNGMYSTPAADPLFCPKCGGSPCCCRDDGGRRNG